MCRSARSTGNEGKPGSAVSFSTKHMREGSPWKASATSWGQVGGSTWTLSFATRTQKTATKLEVESVLGYIEGGQCPPEDWARWELILMCGLYCTDAVWLL